jgi:hypothetical protein
MRTKIHNIALLAFYASFALASASASVVGVNEAIKVVKAGI